MADSNGPMGAAEWIARLASELPAGPAGVPSAEEQQLVLELSRVAAHASERIAAPIASYMLGATVASLSAVERTKFIRQLIEKLGRLTSES